MARMGALMVSGLAFQYVLIPQRQLRRLLPLLLLPQLLLSLKLLPLILKTQPERTLGYKNPQRQRLNLVTLKLGREPLLLLQIRIMVRSGGVLQTRTFSPTGMGSRNRRRKDRKRCLQTRIPNPSHVHGILSLSLVRIIATDATIEIPKLLIWRMTTRAP